MLNQGATIYAASRSKAENWPEEIHFQEMDVLKNPEALANFIPEHLHGLVYAVGNINLKPFARIQAEDFTNDFQLNVVGAAMVIQQALKALKNAEGASIVLISSVAAKTGMGFHASIAASKAALEGFAVALAAEFASQNIRVNVVAPSLTETPVSYTHLDVYKRQELNSYRKRVEKT